ncbi:hypothetical protein [Schaedlerella arabinosiphila]|uniref:hypothetical protein n=1 Tax=Schaedlerella arabinosiphila TaxID=2044587 RepID=UPI0011D02C1E|nr:hypothetical protein [Schaedlerella arabinosiphila]
MIEKTKKDVPANGGISPIQPLVRVKNIQSGVLFKERKKYPTEDNHFWPKYKGMRYAPEYIFSK